MRDRPIVKEFYFEEKNRYRIVLDPKMRLNPMSNVLQLKKGELGYPTDSDLKTYTWIANPNSATRWGGFDVEIEHFEDETGTKVTFDQYRIGDGTNEYFWNGVTWVTDFVNWNTEAEIAENISSLPIVEKKIQVVVNLSTSDQRYTPILKFVKVLYYASIDFYEDWIFRSLVRKMKEEIRPISNFPIELESTGDEIDLNDYGLETSYEITGIDSVFNHTDDPEHLDDIFLSYDSVTKIITMSETVDMGKVVWIRFIYKPVVAVTTNQDYSEVERVPSIILNSIRQVKTYRGDKRLFVRNKANGTAVETGFAKSIDLDITLALITDKSGDQERLITEVKDFFENNKELTSYGLDEKASLFLIDEYLPNPQLDLSSLFSGNLMVKMVNALFFEGTSRESFITQQMVLLGGLQSE